MCFVLILKNSPEKVEFLFLSSELSEESLAKYIIPANANLFSKMGSI